MIHGTDSGAFRALYGGALDGAEIRIRPRCEDTREICYDERLHRLTDEKYILAISSSGAAIDVQIRYSGEKSLFYALCDLAQRKQEGRLLPGCYTESPSFRLRGWIEGFYGPPWSWEARASFLRRMAKQRMNAFFYAPKDDPYHREQWKIPYPENELAPLSALRSEAARFGIEMFWCVSPGLSVFYSSEADFAALMKKTRQLYHAGFRCFGLFLDDIGETLQDPKDLARYGEPVNAHIDLICRYHAALKALSPHTRLAVCPTFYHGRGDEYEIAKLGAALPPDVLLFFTGRDICSRELLCSDAAVFARSTNRPPLYWDNYPVNDMAMKYEMHLGPLIGREGGLGAYAAGLVSNVMEYPHASAVPLITAARYAWEGERYDPERAFDAAIEEVVGREEKDAFACFADHLRFSCLQDENSPRMKTMFRRLEQAVANKDLAGAKALADAWKAQMCEALRYLEQDLPLCRDLAPWTNKFRLLIPIAERLTAFILSKGGAVPAPDLQALERLFEQYACVPWRLAEESDLREVLLGHYALG